MSSGSSAATELFVTVVTAFLLLVGPEARHGAGHRSQKTDILVGLVHNLVNNFREIKTPLALVEAMRWELLFSDLADRFDDLAEHYSEPPTTLTARGDVEPLSAFVSTLCAAKKDLAPVELIFPGGLSRTIRPRTLGLDWCSGYWVEQADAEVIVALNSVAAVVSSQPPETDVSAIRQVRLHRVLTVWASRGEPLVLELDGARCEGVLVSVDPARVTLVAHRGKNSEVWTLALDSLWTISPVSESWR